MFPAEKSFFGIALSFDCKYNAWQMPSKRNAEGISFCSAECRLNYSKSPFVVQIGWVSGTRWVKALKQRFEISSLGAVYPGESFGPPALACSHARTGWLRDVCRE